MTDPLTLAALGATALTKGIEFLYGQAGEVLRRRRERTDDPLGGGDGDGALAGELQPARPNWELIDEVTNELRALRAELVSYAEEGEELDVEDEDLLRNCAALRGVLEAVYQQRITFSGEQREPSGTLIEVHTELDELIDGYSASIAADALEPGTTLRVQRTTRTVRGGQDIGVDLRGR